MNRVRKGSVNDFEFWSIVDRVIHLYDSSIRLNVEFNGQLIIPSRHPPRLP